MSGTGWLVISIIGALAIVAFAVGIPYLITHKGMRAPHDLANRSEARAYFGGKRAFFQRKRRLERQQDTVAAAGEGGRMPGDPGPANRP